MDDFVGSSRFQWSDEELEIATKVRRIFKGSNYLSNPKYSFLSLPIKIKRPKKEKIIKKDPSEAADSDRIIDSVYKYFPNAVIKNTGGLVYHLVLSDMIHNFDEKNDKIIIELLMIIDELYSKLGQNHYGVALAFKED